MPPELLALTVLAFVTRFWGLFFPRAVVWDEIHYERFAGAYFTGNYYIDVHPPLGKLIMAGAAKLLGVSGAVLAAAEPAPLLRVLPAFAGSLIIPVVYLLLRELGCGRRTATLGAFVLLVDNAMLVESRLILPDIILLLFGVLAVLCYALARRAKGSARFMWLAGAAAGGGVAVSIKWTGLSAIGLIGLVWAIEWWVYWRRERRADWRALVREAGLLTVIPIAIYLGSFAAHFALLRHGRTAADPVMSDETRAILNNLHAIQPSKMPTFAESFIVLNRQMASINEGWATSTHPAASKWYTWPIAKHSIGYWNDSGAPRGTERWIILFANPLVWWGVMTGAIVTIVALVRGSKALERRRAVLAALGAGYICNFVPFAFIQRPMFLYHYFFALVYSVLFAAVGIGALAGWDRDDGSLWRFPSVMSRRLFLGFAGIAAALFLYLIPMSYGWSLSKAGVLHRRWILERHFSVSGDS